MMFGKCFMHEGVCTLGCGVVPTFGYKILTSGDVAGVRRRCWFGVVVLLSGLYLMVLSCLCRLHCRCPL
ncbi:hypothetical protein Hanom_Chr04g00319841 [Helianthus anomalus]